MSFVGAREYCARLLEHVYAGALAPYVRAASDSADTNVAHVSQTPSCYFPVCQCYPVDCVPRESPDIGLRVYALWFIGFCNAFGMLVVATILCARRKQCFDLQLLHIEEIDGISPAFWVGLIDKSRTNWVRFCSFLIRYYVFYWLFVGHAVETVYLYWFSPNSTMLIAHHVLTLIYVPMLMHFHFINGYTLLGFLVHFSMTLFQTPQIPVFYGLYIAMYVWALFCYFWFRLQVEPLLVCMTIVHTANLVEFGNSENLFIENAWMSYVAFVVALASLSILTKQFTK